MDEHHTGRHPVSRVDDTSLTVLASRAQRRAVVFGGGGATGNAWALGVAAGLAGAGVDLRQADRTIGTSSGATAAAQLTAVAPQELYEAATALPTAPRQQCGRDGAADRAQGVRDGSGGGALARARAQDQLHRTTAIIEASASPAEMRRRLGAGALALLEDSDGSWQEQWHSTVASRLPGATWPERQILLTAVDARTGDPVILDRGSGVDLVDAVAASCSSGLPYAVGGRLLIDGGYRRNENADLAAGCERVLVLSPFGGRSRHPAAWGTDLATQVRELEAAGSSVIVLTPEDPARRMLGARAVDVSRRAEAAQAGHAVALAHAEAVQELWD